MPAAIFDHLYVYAGGYMFLVLAVLLFSGYPVGLVLGGVALMFGAAGIALALRWSSPTTASANWG